MKPNGIFCRNKSGAAVRRDPQKTELSRRKMLARTNTLERMPLVREVNSKIRWML